jgi:uncharacterized protein YjbI with pentapeptide repeats
MVSVHTRRKITLAITLTFLSAASDIVIFHWENTINRLKAGIAGIPHGFREVVIALGTGLVLLCVLIIFRWAIGSGASFARYLWALPLQTFDELKPEDRIKFENDLRANRIQVITTVVQALGGIAVLIGIYFAWANLKATQEAQKNTQKSQEETIRITNEGQITDRFTKAIDQLGNTQPDVRLGGIYALERIARDSEKDHWPIMEILTTFVRVHAPVTKTEAPHSMPVAARVHGSVTKTEAPHGVPVAAPSPDIQAILTVIGRRELSYEKGKNERLNLNGANLAGANLIGAQLSNTDLEGANLTGAALNNASLNHASLKNASLNNASLNNASLNNASLFEAGLEGADLTRADLKGSNLLAADLRDAVLLGAHLVGAKLEGANLMKTDLVGAELVNSNLESANLADADLEYANLAHTDLKSADLTRANLNNANLSGADLKITPGQIELYGIVGISQEQVNSALGDRNTVLPSGIVMPESWKHAK